MQSTFLINLKKQNEFPIIFIGSGITKRYFKDAPTWDKLLNKIWDELHIKQTYFSRYHQLENKYSGDSFKIYSKIALELEGKYDDAFFDEFITLNNLTPQDAHKNQQSPFRTKIAEIFSNLEKRTGIDEELNLFKAMLKQARMIVTTNYDMFIEELLDHITVKVGNKGLFEDQAELNELYKIHGSVKDPDSIVITEEDYKKLDRTSAIVNAKILSQLTRSPILFFGYSMTDSNVISLMQDLSDNMPFSIEQAARRVGVVNYDPRQSALVETMEATKFHYTVLTTNDFTEIYRTVSQIDQGISPYEISKFQKAFRQIIDVKGQQRELKQVLTSFVDLKRLPRELKNKNLVVAFGDNRYIYKYPDYVSYVKNYFLENATMPLEIAIKFIANRPSNSTLPVSKYLIQIKGEMVLDSTDQSKINKRLSHFCSLESLNVRTISKHDEDILKKTTFNTSSDVIDRKDGVQVFTKIAYITKNIFDYDKKFVLDLIKSILKKRHEGFIKDTNCRKLFMAYTLKFEEIISNI